MSEGKKEIPPADLSLKYMAWNVKEIAESMQKMEKLLYELVDEFRRMNKPAQERTPF